MTKFQKAFRKIEDAKDWIETMGYNRHTVWSYANIINGKISIQLPHAD